MSLLRQTLQLPAADALEPPLTSISEAAASFPIAASPAKSCRRLQAHAAVCGGKHF